MAVLLAGAGAILFGLAAVRQHQVVRLGAEGTDQGLDLGALRRILREPAWLVGAAQSTLAGAAHLAALALAPVVLVQPVGVLAVPVTLVGTAVQRGRRPSLREVGGALLVIVAIATLTVVLLGSAGRVVRLPGWRLPLGVVLGATAGGLVLVVGSRSWPDRLRCVVLASTAAVLFGLNAVLLRAVGHLLVTGSAAPHAPLVATALGGVAVALLTGVWAVQSAYTAGAPQVVLCCLTLLDPLTAVLGGEALLGDGVVLDGLGWTGVGACVAVATVGVLLLAGGWSGYSVVGVESVAESADGVECPEPEGDIELLA